jgi:hypothetical protein
LMLRDHWADRRKGPPLSRKPIPRQLPWRCGTGRRNESGGFSMPNWQSRTRGLNSVGKVCETKQLAHSSGE